MTAPIVYQFFIPLALLIFGVIMAVIGFLIKNAISTISKKIDHLEKKLDDNSDKNENSHKELRESAAKKGERLAVCEERTTRHEKQIAELFDRVNR